MVTYHVNAFCYVWAMVVHAIIPFLIQTFDIAIRKGSTQCTAVRRDNIYRYRNATCYSIEVGREVVSSIKISGQRVFTATLQESTHGLLT